MFTGSSRGKRRLLALLLLPLLVGTTYKWRDSDGQLHLTDAPPPPGVAYEVVAVPGSSSRPPAPAGPVSVPQAVPSAAPVSVPAAPAVDQAALAAARAESDRRCVETLYQLDLLGMQLRVFKFGPGNTRTYLDDRDRPAEIRRLNGLKEAACEGDKAYLAAQQRKAGELQRTLSPGCREDREKVELMRRDPHTPRRDLEAKEARVRQLCPDVPDLATRDLWLADWVL